jgi:hypothetical protein
MREERANMPVDVLLTVHRARDRSSTDCLSQHRLVSTYLQSFTLDIVNLTDNSNST